MISQPPQMPVLSTMPIELRDYLSAFHEWATDVYAAFRNYDIGTLKLSSGPDAPTGGEDGDLYIRNAGASTKLYLNINGTFSGFNNP